MTPYNLQKHVSAEYTMCTEPTLSMQQGTCCSPRQWEPEAMAPTSDALRFHLKRVHYQSMMWRNAHCPTPELPTPSEMGWRLVDSELQPVLMTLSLIPDRCIEMVACSCRKQCKARRCKCQKSGLRCASMCACQHQMDDQTAGMNRHS